jgi:argininosuccinate lyase
MTGMILDMTPNNDILSDSAKSGFSTATDVADWIVRELGVPFREAHRITGCIVRLAEERKCELKDLALNDLKAIENRITSSIYSIMSVESSVNSRDSFGGTAPIQVKAQLKKWKKRLS